MSTVLFILKKREELDDETGKKKIIETGLYNSSTYLNTILNNMNINSNIEMAIDNNCIDRIVTKHRPKYVIIEALWVVPSKFDILCRLHPTVKWIIRFHSEMPFLACEGMATQWIIKYSLFPNLILGINSKRLLREVQFIVKLKNNFSEEDVDKKVVYLPNFYPIDVNIQSKLDKELDTINICCFGAIRPLKNQLIQATAAIEFANKIGKKLRYHINSTRHETNGLPVYNNIKGLFIELNDERYTLVEHNWKNKEDFLLLCGQMDIGLQVSFSETFNIVGCDLLSQNVPIIFSNDIPWSKTKYNADPTDSIDIVDKLLLTYNNSQDNVETNIHLLKEFTNETVNVWVNFFSNKL
jgi:hypothetical protein